MTMDGSIVASFITSGFMSADRLQGGTLKIGGINNINGEILVVDSEENELVKIGIDGVTLSNGTKLIGGNGVLSNFQFNGKSTCTNEGDFLGFEPMYVNDTNTKTKIIIDALIPENFEITEAKIHLVHTPIYFKSDLNNTGFWGYARKMQAYKVTDLDFKRTAVLLSTYVDDVNYEMSDTQAFGANGYTPSEPSNSSYTTESVTSIDIKEFLSNGYNMLIIESNEEIPALAGDMIEEESYSKTGQVKATLNVIGYMK